MKPRPTYLFTFKNMLTGRIATQPACTDNMSAAKAAAFPANERRD